MNLWIRLVFSDSKVSFVLLFTLYWWDWRLLHLFPLRSTYPEKFPCDMRLFSNRSIAPAKRPDFSRTF